MGGVGGEGRRAGGRGIVRNIFHIFHNIPHCNPGNSFEL